MSGICQVTGRRSVSGTKVSHANNKTKRLFKPNLRSQRFWIASEGRWVRLRVSTAAMRTIDKKGIEAVVAGMRREGKRI
ncbi:MAG: 50S ribosomal protein L28 [Thermoanaerobaculia bacterium]